MVACTVRPVGAADRLVGAAGALPLPPLLLLPLGSGTAPAGPCTLCVLEAGTGLQGMASDTRLLSSRCRYSGTGQEQG